MKKLSFEEQHSLLLAIAKAFDAVCVKKNIPYYMLGGTMLGAIRHKGFIPWDDDMDFGVPREFFDELPRILEKELPSRYRCRTIYNSPNIILPFYKIEDTFTRCEMDEFVGTEQEALGINIDIFPLDKCNINDSKLKYVLWIVDKYARIYSGAAHGNKLNNIVKGIIRFFIPFRKVTIYKFIEIRTKSQPKGTYLGNLYGRWKEKEIVPNDWYGEDQRYKFEDFELIGFSNYDKYLTQLYNNYMELPPIDKRTTHSKNVLFLGEGDIV